MHCGTGGEGEISSGAVEGAEQQEQKSVRTIATQPQWQKS
jgi:hypothetical protein